MWYVLRVCTGKEEKLKKLCETYIGKEILDNCFCPKYESVYKEKGIRRIVTKVLFPGYLFLDTNFIEKVREQIRDVPEFTKILGADNEYIPITSEEQSFIMKHGNAEHIFKMSKGYITGEEIVITEGAFEGYKGKLKYVDRHNRYGIIEIEMFGRNVDMKFGLEIIGRLN